MQFNGGPAMNGIMRKLALGFLVLAFWMVLGVWGSEAESPRQNLSLDTAIARGQARVEFRGRGASTGDSIILRITNLTTNPLVVGVTPGTVLRSASAGIQDMIAERVRGIPMGEGRFRPAAEISLAPKATAEYILLAYCLNFDRANPDPQSRFTVGRVDSPELQKLFAVLSQVSPQQRTIGSVQAAVWAITGDVTREQLQSRFPTTEADIANARRLLERAGIDPRTKRLFR